MDLFDKSYDQKIKEIAPLADRIRPVNLTEFLGQKHILGPGKPLRKLITSDAISSIILWGPPGSGKTTIAKIIAEKTKSEFIQISAVTSSVAEVRQIIKKGKDRIKFEGRRTILFVDEIHRFNKAQQDAFLPWVENGTIILVGATTENPSFEVTSPLMSRTKVFKLEPLTDNNLKAIIMRALKDQKRGLGKLNLKIEPKAITYIINHSGGDARVALNALEFAALTKKDRHKIINLEDAKEAAHQKSIYYDKQGDYHYDTISAFIKSIRGSDPDAALYWLARMIDAGEDPRFIARRMIILASEDIGNADPHALMVATAAASAVEYVGLPEAQLNLAQATTYLASAPKSNASYLAYLNALKDVKTKKIEPVPIHLRNAPTDLMRDLGFGRDYQYAHNFAEHFAPDQEYRPKKLQDKIYYKPSEQGFEIKIKERLNQLRNLKRKKK